MNPIHKLIFIVVFLLIALAVGPVFSIWSLNTLFGTAIDINWQSYLSALWLQVLVMGATQ